MDGAASSDDEAGDIHGGRQGIETWDADHESAMDTIDDDDFFFDLETGDDIGSEDGTSRFDVTDSSTNTSSPSKGNRAGGGEANYGKKAGNVGDRYQKTDDFWRIASKTFASEDEAFTFYNNYAKDKGFGVRKEKVRRLKHSREIVFRRFVCCREGERDGKWLDKEDYSRRPRALTRCDCSALLDIRLDRSRGVYGALGWNKACPRFHTGGRAHLSDEFDCGPDIFPYK